MKALLTFVATLLSLMLVAQPERRSVVIGAMTTRPNALLIVNPQHANQGVLLPQLSTGQRMSMKPSSPHEDGLIVYDKNASAYFYWSNGGWTKLRSDDTRQTKYSTVDPTRFQELKPDNDIRHSSIVIFGTDNSFVTANRTAQMMAPVDIPHGARLTGMTIFYFDNDDDDISVSVLRKTLSGGSDVILTWQSSGSSDNIRSVSFTDFNGREVVDLENYSYRLLVAFDIDADDVGQTPAQARQRIYGVKIRYQE